MTSPPPLQLVPPAAGEEPSDDVLMALAAEGSRPAFDRLVRRHEARMRGFCRLLVQDAALADDVAQEAFVRLWQARARYRPGGRLRELLFTIARNLCRSARRKQAVRELFGLADTAPPPSTPDDVLETAERDALIRGAIARLPPKFREPLLLRFVEGMSSEEIARVIGRTPSAARSRIHYGLQQLERLLPPEILR